MTHVLPNEVRLCVASERVLKVTLRFHRENADAGTKRSRAPQSAERARAETRYGLVMSSARIEQLLFVLGPALASLLAGLIATVRPASGKVRSAVLHFAGGVVFSVVAVELIPDLLREHAPVYTAVGFATGVAVMLGVRALLESKEADADDDEPAEPLAAPGRVERSIIPMAMLVAIGVDLAVDGVLLGIGFAAGAKEGRMLAFALATELVALALATVATLQRRGASRASALRILGGLLAVFVASAVAGTLLLAHLSGHALVFVLAFGSAALLFLVTEELLVEAHEEKETAWMTATFFAGFLLFLVIGVIG